SSGFGGALPPANAADGYGTGGMGATAGGGVATAPAGPSVKFRDIESDEEVAVDTVQVVGSETLYRRGKQWFAANAQDVDLKRDQEKIKVVEKFSDEYFRLVADNTASQNAVLARQQSGEELVIRLRGQIYLIR
ncbi:MAG: hypothetical protein JJ992_12405, partial [Planctomycetes bacterium]|nr:hypothetical protein [Planctomycetota bacterium]